MRMRNLGFPSDKIGQYVYIEKRISDPCIPKLFVLFFCFSAAEIESTEHTFIEGFSSTVPCHPGWHCGGRGTSKSIAASLFDFCKYTIREATATTVAVSNAVVVLLATQWSASIVVYIFIYLYRGGVCVALEAREHGAECFVKYRDVGASPREQFLPYRKSLSLVASTTRCES